MNDSDNGCDDGVLIDTICGGCELCAQVNDLGLCDACFMKLERDLIRARDWDYSATAFATPLDQLEALRERIIREYGAKYELIEDPNAVVRPKGKNKRTRSRETQRKRAIATKAIRDYDTEDVLQAAREFLREQGDEWVNFSRLSQHLYETFYQFKPKRLGPPDRKYKSLLKFLNDCPSDFELKEDAQKRGLYWIRLISKQRA